MHDGDTDGTIANAVYCIIDDDNLCDDQRLFYLNNANFNITALVNQSGTVVERYSYDPYGQVTVLDGTAGGQTDWAADADGDSDGDNEILYCGYRYDPETYLYHVRNRDYHPTLGRWMQRDPIGYMDGMSLYQYVGGRPVAITDPEGLAPQTSLEKYHKINEWYDAMAKAIKKCLDPRRSILKQPNIRQMIEVKGALAQFRADLKKEILDKLDKDDVAKLLKAAEGTLAPNAAAKEAHKYLKRVRGHVSPQNINAVEEALQKAGVDTKGLEEKITAAWSRTGSIRDALDTASKLVDAADKLNRLVTAKTDQAKMQVALNIALDGVGSKIPALGPMMAYYQKAIDAIFKKIDDISWDRADNFTLKYWQETCCDTGEGIILTYRWAKNYKPGSLSTYD